MPRFVGFLATVLLAIATHAALAADPADTFLIEVVDAATGRGVPLVELRTVNAIRYVTDSAGRVAFDEPGLMDRKVFFHVSSHGYTYPKDGFGMRGKALRTTPGATARLTVRRTNIAERLYRVTGQGIYRDTALAGLEPPIRRPVLNGRVLGQDSVFAVPYRGKLYWFWGDTNRESYPLGQFATSGATSALPADGGLDPAVGVDLTYFVDEAGFSRKMAPLPERGMVWLNGLITVRDDAGRERLVAHYARMKSLGERLEHGLMVYNDAKEVFERARRLDDNVWRHPMGQATRVTREGRAYWTFAQPHAHLRVRDQWDAVFDPAAYEALTCLAPGSAYDEAEPALDRDAGGRLVWGWKRDTGFVDYARQKALVRSGAIRPEERWIDLKSPAGKPVVAHRGSVRWNAYRDRWVMIFCQQGGTSFLGEIWYAEADAPEGPWRTAVKVVTHDTYSLYNPVHHAFFDADGGRVIYFEGTYTKTFSAAKAPTPRYDYNQIMYRLDLSDARLQPARGKRPAGEGAAKP